MAPVEARSGNRLLLPANGRSSGARRVWAVQQRLVKSNERIFPRISVGFVSCPAAEGGRGLAPPAAPPRQKSVCYHHLMRRNRRNSVAWLCLSALLFLQIAVAAYACPAPVGNGAAALAPAASAMPSCPGVDDQAPKLCEQHCVVGAQSVDTQPHSTVVAPVVPLMTVLVRSDLRLTIGPATRGDSLPTTVDPPPLVRFGVLRI